MVNPDARRVYEKAKQGSSREVLGFQKRDDAFRA